MHSFDNGVGMKVKLGNWSLLEKYFKKRGLKITRKMIDDVIHNKPNAAVPIIEEVYTFLTDRVYVASWYRHDTERFICD